MNTLWIVLIVIGILALAALSFFFYVGYNIQKARKQGRIEGQKMVDEINATNAINQGREQPKKKFAYQGNPYRKAPTGKNL